jgi:ATP-binding cassette subfamily B protein
MRGSNVQVSFKDTNWQVITALLPYLKEYRQRVVLALLCLVGAKVASVGLPFVLKHIVDALDKTADQPVLLLPLALLIGYGIIRFANVLFGELRDTLFGRVTERAMRRVGLRVFRHLHNLDIAFHLDRRTGGLSRDIERGTSGISFLMRFMVFNIVPTLLEIGMVMGLLWWQYHIGFALVVLLSVVAYIGFSVFTTEWRTGFLRQVNQAESQSSTRAVDSLLNYETVKLFNNEAFECDRYDQDLANWESARRRNRLSLFVLNSGQAFIIATAMSVAMIMAAQDVTTGAMTLGDFVLVNSFMMQIFMPLNFLGFVYREMKGSLASIERMFDLLQVTPQVTSTDGAKPLTISQGAIEFDQVNFHYTADRPILKNISFSIAPQQKVAIVGSSGAGKSTLSKLLFRFYDPQSGAIKIDGQPIDQATLDSVRSSIGIIPQDTVLFNDTLWENVKYGAVDATPSDIEQAIKVAHLENFTQQLPDGAQTQVGERGLKLSGGEKQRVAIARAVLKKPPIMIFDEATSSLDSQSEQEILSALKEVAKEQTTLVIAHRLSTIVDADRIIVLDQGEIVEQGTHAELLNKRGRYHTLWELQQSEQAKD